MKLETARARQLDAYLKEPGSEVKDLKRRVELKGKIQILSGYRVPIKLLIYNIRNGRFAAELMAKEGGLKRKLDPTTEADAKIIQKLLLDQSESETQALREDLKAHGQLEPGIITFDGAVINANRRMAILSALFEETREPKYEYLMVGRLPPNVDEKDLWRIEAGLQFAKDFRLEYGPVNELLKLKEGRDRGLTEKDISRSLLGRYSVIKIKEKLEILKLIETYLEFIGKPREFHFIHDERSVEKFNSLQASVVAPLKRQEMRDSDIAKLVTLAFLIIEKTDLSHWDVRKLSKIADDPAAKGELFKAYDPKDPRKVSEEIVEEAFSTAKEIVEDREEEDRPERLVKRALSAVQSIKPSSKLKEPAVHGLLRKLLEEVSRLLSA
ncbi:MAG: hypothetical protein ACRD2L_07100 [Terriglobia bacterium]